jgi:hypothetical protein
MMKNYQKSRSDSRVKRGLKKNKVGGREGSNEMMKEKLTTLVESTTTLTD